METGSQKRTWKLVLAYDGTDFYGWQVQPGRRTVQGELGAAIERIAGERVLPQGSGRTDAGVHALAQVASFRLSAPIPEANLVRALNRTLPAAIRVLEARRMPDGFHARHSARGKTYEYRILCGEFCPPWLARYVYGLNQPIDIAAMQRAALWILGEHDFTSFAAGDPDQAQRNAEEPPSGAVIVTGTGPRLQGNVRAIYESRWIHREDDPSGSHLLVYRVRGSGFLHHMVRNLVGTFLEAGRGRLSAAKIPEILAARKRASAGPTAPARGLFLTKVDY